MTDFWQPRLIETVQHLESELFPLRDRGWLFRGQSRVWGRLVPSIDRTPREHLGRAVKLFLERRSIEAFRQNVRSLTNQSERLAMTDPHIALMVLRHYDVPTRILDWTRSPQVASFFSSEVHETSDAEILAFDEPLYEAEGAKQWEVGPPVTRDSEFHPQYTMFMPDLDQIDWFICAFYFPDTFPRQRAQQGAFSLTARFEVDHAHYLARLLKSPERCLRFIIPGVLKRELLDHLRINHGVHRAALFPDADTHSQASAVNSANEVFRT